MNGERNTPTMFPRDLRNCIPEDEMAHFVSEAVNGIDLAMLSIKWRGCGLERCPSEMTLRLLIYCEANSTFTPLVALNVRGLERWLFG